MELISASNQRIHWVNYKLFQLESRNNSNIDFKRDTGILD